MKFMIIDTIANGDLPSTAKTIKQMNYSNDKRNCAFQEQNDNCGYSYVYSQA
jgi:hypothetical protein